MTVQSSSGRKTGNPEPSSKHPPRNEWGPLDHDLLRLLGRVSSGQRICNMLEAQDFAMGLIRGRLERQFPHMSAAQINIRIFEEIARDERTRSRFRSLRRHHQDT